MTFIIGTPHTHNAGYYRNDDTPSGGKKAEADIQTCAHCQKILTVTGAEVGWCGREQKLVCGTGECAARTEKFGCVPFLKQLEQTLERDHRLTSFAKLAGLNLPTIGG